MDDKTDLPEAIQFLCSDFLEKDIGIEMKGIKGAPDWFSFETKIWELGECLRQRLKKQKGWSKNKELAQVIMMICRNRKYGKGRQAFVMLLGESNSEDASKLLGELLDDSEVIGHSIKALTKLKVGQYVDKVRQIAETEAGWIRTAAKNYCKKFSTGEVDISGQLGARKK